MKRRKFAVALFLIAAGSALLVWGMAQNLLLEEVKTSYRGSLGHELYTEEQGAALLRHPLIVALRLIDEDAVRSQVDAAVCFSYVFNGFYGVADEVCSSALNASPNQRFKAQALFLRAAAYAHQAGRVPQALALAEEDLRLLVARHDNPNREAALLLLEYIEILKRSIEEQASAADPDGEPIADDDDPASWLQDPDAVDEDPDEHGF